MKSTYSFACKSLLAAFITCAIPHFAVNAQTPPKVCGKTYATDEEHAQPGSVPIKSGNRNSSQTAPKTRQDGSRENDQTGRAGNQRDNTRERD